jgi:hypothetical protein
MQAYASAVRRTSVDWMDRLLPLRGNRPDKARPTAEPLEMRLLFDTVLYGSFSAGNDLVSVDVTTGQVTTPGGTVPQDFAESPSGQFYGFISDTAAIPTQLFSFSSPSFSETMIGGYSQVVQGPVFSPTGTFYGVGITGARNSAGQSILDSNGIVTLSTSGGTPNTSVNLSDLGSQGYYALDLACDGSGTLFATAEPVDSSGQINGNVESLLKIDVSSGAVTVVGTFASPADSITFATDGKLYAIDGDGNLDVVNLQNAGLTQVLLGGQPLSGLVPAGESFFATMTSLPPAPGTADSGGGGGSGGSGGGTSVLSATIAKSTLPSSVVDGVTTHKNVVVYVDNNTSATESGKITVGIYASADGTVDGAATLLGLGVVPKSTKLRAGAKIAINVPIKSLPTSLVGSYTLLAQATDQAGNSAVSSTGLALTAALPFVSFSDTLVQNTLAPTNVSGHKTKAKVELQVTNNGNVVSAGRSTVAIYLSPDTTATGGTLVRSDAEPIALKPGASRLLNLPLIALPALSDSSYYLVVVVTDPKKDVTLVASTDEYLLMST